jgi:regulator of replication initiation timing
MGILENVKEVSQAVHEIHNLELYQRVLTLHADVIEIVEENNCLRKRNEELGKLLALREDMTFEEPFYYRSGDEIPHCPACWEAHQKAVHVVFAYAHTETTGWDCPNCDHRYTVKKDHSIHNPAAPRRRVPRPGEHSWMAS